MAACAWLASKPWHTTHKAPPAANCMESNQLVTHMSSCEGMNGWGIQTWTLTWVISCQGAGPSMNKWFDSFPVRVLSFHHEGWVSPCNNEKEIARLQTKTWANKQPTDSTTLNKIKKIIKKNGMSFPPFVLCVVSSENLFPQTSWRFPAVGGAQTMEQ